MPKFTVQYNAGARPDCPSDEVEAEYYKREHDWTTFKNAEHKVVFDVPNHAILAIRVVPGADSK